MTKTGEKVLIKGNHAIAKAALNAGCKCYFGYPITPQNEIGEYLSVEMPKIGRSFLQAESEVAAINMLLGAAATGTRAMTSSSSLAIALMQEGISYIAADNIPAVVISVMRAGPALGYIFPSQGDYFQTVKGGGNGDYKTLTLAPSTVQEMVDFTYKAFHLAHKYRTIVFLLADGMLGQMMEPAVIYDYPYEDIDNSDWALDGAKNRAGRWIGSIHRTEEVLEQKTLELFEKYNLIKQNEIEYETMFADDADILITAFGSVARIAKAAIKKARAAGIKVGLFRPISLWPFPTEELNKISKGKKLVLDIEMNMGQMVEDVKIAVNGETKVDFFGRPAGYYFTPDEIYTQIEKSVEGLK